MTLLAREGKPMGGRGCGPGPGAGWWTVRDVAARLGRTAKAVRRAVERGHLPAPEVRMRRRRWRPATILGWEEQRRIAGLRWPVGVLVEVCGSVDSLAEAVGVSPGLVYYYWTAGGLPDRVADEWAIGVGFHPAVVWGWEWVAAGLPAVDCCDREGDR